MGTVVFLVGPKAVGKTWAGRVLEERLGVHHVDADPLIRDLSAQGVAPDPIDGWLAWVQPEVEQALTEHAAVSVEATGAWETDFKLADNLELAGSRVIRVLLVASERETMARMKVRVLPTPIPAAEASEIYRNAATHNGARTWDLIFDTSGEPRPDAFMEAFRPLLT